MADALQFSTPRTTGPTPLPQVLASDVEGHSPSLMLFIDKEGRYLFNAGEGLQRIMRERKLKMQKVRERAVGDSH